MAQEFDPILTLDYFARTMYSGGRLPNTVSGVEEDSFALSAIATQDPTQLQAALVESTIISHDIARAEANRTTTGSMFGLLDAVINEPPDEAIMHPDGTAFTVEEFDAWCKSSRVFDAAMRRRAREQHTNEEARLIWDANQTRALEQAKYDPNEAVRIYNARRVLSRRAARIALGMSSFVGTASGVLASEVVTTDPSTGVLALSASAGMLLGGAIGSLLRSRTARNSARRRANRLLQQRSSEG